MKKVKPIAFYLPQFHPIPENNEWWGNGFTEWRNVTKAKPLYKGHWQPRLPTDLGFYDLRLEEARIAQAKIAAKYGVYGFAYWHYWFGNGKQLLERPLKEVVGSGKPVFPFCLAWANQTWAGTWHGLSSKKILIEQLYPGIEDYSSHFFSILPALKDKRYIEIEGKKLFMIFRVNDIPNISEFTNLWQNLAKQNGFAGFHFVAIHDNNTELVEQGIDAFIQSQPERHLLIENKNAFKKIAYKLKKLINTKQNKCIERTNYDVYLSRYPQYELKPNEYPMIYPDWDNSPRCGNDGWMFYNSSPSKFNKLVRKAIEIAINQKNNPENIIVIKSWNEWAEGNYLEPDDRYNFEYLEALKNAINS